jgi:hypothetical protein
MMKRVTMKLDRLQKMSREEISYRLHEMCRIQSDRCRYWLRLGLEPADDLRHVLATHQDSFKNYLESAAQRFYASLAPQVREKTVDVISRTLPDEVDRALEEGERLLGHRVNLLGYHEVALGKDIDWHRDPVTGRRWSRRFWADYDLVRDGSADPKIIHELNRQQHLPRLAKAYLLTRDERFAREAVSQMESWDRPESRMGRGQLAVEP